jgi:hypothetical protein
MAAGRLVRAAARLLRVLGEDDAAIAGGVAVNAHGYVRATRDVDVIVKLPLAEAQRRLEAQGIAATLFRGDVLEGDFHCLKGVLGSGRSTVRFDVLSPLVPLDPAQFVSLDLRGQRLTVVDLPTLLRLKVRAGGIRDLYDVAMLVSLNPGSRAAFERAAANRPRELERIRSMIDDPRTRAAVAEIRGEERAARKAARPRERRGRVRRKPRRT